MDAGRAGSKGEEEAMMLRFRLKRCTVEWGLILILVICVVA
jgi:hypothetical protein